MTLDSFGFMGFFAGAVYGVTSVLVGQPLDTIKTRMQAQPTEGKFGAMRLASQLFKAEGLRGLYRGATPVVLGGTIFRSAQFGAYEVAVRALRETTPSYKIGGVLDWQVAVAGAAGGVARCAVEAPFEKVKVAAQVAQKQRWTPRHLYDGCAVMLVRNVILFSTFAISMDVLPPLMPEGKVGDFWTGAACSNLAWLVCWPMDVVKSQRQSGNYAGHSGYRLLLDSFRSGTAYRGLIPGLARSTVANGTAMTVYKKILEIVDH
jgi:solute carrier family 25 carnitine/acylcarnitine transporter 20/29